MGEEGAHVEVGVALLFPGLEREDLAALGDEGAERGEATGVGGDELHVVGHDVGAVAARAGGDAVPGGEDQLPGRAVDRGPRAEGVLAGLAQEDAAIDRVRGVARGQDFGPAGAGAGFVGEGAEPEPALATGVDAEFQRPGAAHPRRGPVALDLGDLGPFPRCRGAVVGRRRGARHGRRGGQQRQRCADPRQRDRAAGLAGFGASHRR